jgi:hypothetical protein
MDSEIRKFRVNLRAAQRRVNVARELGDLRKFRNAKLSQDYWQRQLGE